MELFGPPCKSSRLQFAAPPTRRRCNKTVSSRRCCELIFKRLALLLVLTSSPSTFSHALKNAVSPSAAAAAAYPVLHDRVRVLTACDAFRQMRH